ncbi:MAG: acetate kinase [Gemmatimonadota bacterium]
MSILVVNAGSSTLKFSLYDSAVEQRLAMGAIDWGGGKDQADFSIEHSGEVAAEHAKIAVKDHGEAAVHLVRTILDSPRLGGHIPAIGNRVVHGGEAFSGSMAIDAEVIAQIRRLCSIAPLHNPPALAVIEATRQAMPDLPQVAVFDTAFFAGLPEEAYIYPVPYEWYEKWRVRRFGFHGTSHAHSTGRAAEMLDRHDPEFRVVTCHLGSGCSASAARGGKAVATTMGLTPLEGLMMSTRPGSIDPGILIYALREGGLSPDELDRALNRQSGLLGLSGVSSDYRAVEAAAAAGNRRAQLALTIFARRIRETIAQLAADLEGLDAVVFTAGIGQNSVALRSRVCQGLGFLGLELDEDKNRAAVPDVDISAGGTRVRVLVISCRENYRIARETRRVVNGG